MNDAPKFPHTNGAKPVPGPEVTKSKDLIPITRTPRNAAMVTQRITLAQDDHDDAGPTGPKVQLPPEEIAPQKPARSAPPMERHQHTQILNVSPGNQPPVGALAPPPLPAEVRPMIAPKAPPIAPPLKRKPVRIEYRLVPSNPTVMPMITVTEQWIIMGQRPINPTDIPEPRLLATIVNPFLSGMHLSAIVHEGELIICDMTSRNGSWILEDGKTDYEQLVGNEPRVVKSGDKIILASQDIIYTVAVGEIFNEIWYQEGHQVTRTQDLINPHEVLTTQVIPRIEPRN